jgi:hypothetical protein
VNDDLVRLEYKLDLIIHALMDKGIMLDDLPRIEGIEEDTCPVCKNRIKVYPDYSREAVRYCCGCITPNKVVPGISELLIPNEEKSHGSARIEESDRILEPEKESGSGS